MLIPTKPSVFIPIETTSRELISKILLSQQLASNGFEIYLGQKGKINRLIRFFKNGIYIDKGYHKGQSEKIYKILKERKFYILSLDEENAVDFKNNQQLNDRFPDDVLGIFDKIFLWGGFQYNFLKDKRPSFNEKHTIISGHPRFELLKNEFQFLYEPKSIEYKETFGKFILVNTNFGLGNNIRGEKFVIENYKDRFPDIEQHILYHKKQQQIFIDLVFRLSKETKYNIVFRPHPEEDHEVYDTVFKALNNVFVLYDGSVIPWLLASEFMIHSDCTTSLECAMLGKSSIAYTKYIDEKFTTDIPLRISFNYDNETEVINHVNSKIDNSRIDNKILTDYFNFNENSLKIIVDNITENFKNINTYKIQNLAVIKCYFFLKKIIKQILFRFDDKLIQKKLSGFDYSESKQILKILNLKYSSNIEINKIDGKLFKIYKK